jgi:hypothetical protein
VYLAIYGRPKGSRNKLSENFLTDFLETWTMHGKQALQEMATKNPAVFVRVAASLIPQHFRFEPDHSIISEMSAGSDQGQR